MANDERNMRIFMDWFSKRDQQVIWLQVQCCNWPILFLSQEVGRNTRHLFPALAVSFVLYTRIDHSQGFAFLYIYEYVLYIFCFLIKKRHLFDKKSKGVYISYIFFKLRRFWKRAYIFFIFTHPPNGCHWNIGFSSWTRISVAPNLMKRKGCT